MINRQARDVLLEAVVSFMKGEITNDEFDDWRRAGVQACRRAGDVSATRVGYLLWFFYDELVTHSISLSREHWDLLQRYAAFLRSDLEIEVIRRREFRPRQVFALLGLLILGAATVMLVHGGSPILLIAAWLVVGGIWAFWPRRRFGPPDVESLWRFAPFQSEQQWRKYQPLLHEFNLPAHEPAIHHQPPRSRKLSVLAWLHHRLAGFIFLPIALVWNALPVRHTVYVVEGL